MHASITYKYAASGLDRRKRLTSPRPVKHVIICFMTRMTVRDVRLHWPKAEKALAEGEEIVITRDSKPVARLLPFVTPEPATRPRFDPTEHMVRLKRLWARTPKGPSTDVWLNRDRED